MDINGVTDKHDQLNPAIWHDLKLDTAVKNRLVRIADAFEAWVELPIHRIDLLLTGSAAGYSYSVGQSDLDLHLVFDFKKAEHGAVLHSALSAKQAVWNLEHHISIRGLPVELYVQAADEPHFSSGVFSIERHGWLTGPTPAHGTADPLEIARKVENWRAQIDRAVGGKSPTEISKLRRRLKADRQTGLNTAGELSAANLAFKALRRAGDIGRLMAAGRNAQDAELSLGADHSYQDVDLGIADEILNTTTAAVRQLVATP